MFFPSVTVEVRKSDKVQQMRCKNCICLFSGNDILLTEVKENYDMQIRWRQLPGNELPGLKRMIQGSFASTYPDTAIPTVTMLLYFSAS